MSLIKMEDVVDFWRIISPKDREDLIEIRILIPNTTGWMKKREIYRILQKIAKEENIMNKNLTQFFVRDVGELKSILVKDVVEHTKICYGVNERRVREIEGECMIGGSFEFLENIRMIYFDIETTNHEDCENMQWLLDKYTTACVEKIKQFGLKNPTIVNSGAGRHLLYNINRVKSTTARKEWIKEYCGEISKLMSNEYFKIDEIADVTRILGLPTTLNVKRGKWVRVMKYSFYVNDFEIKSKKKKKIKIVEGEKNAPHPDESVEFQILRNSDCPEGDITNTILFAFKLILKENGMANKNDYKKYEDIINKAWNSRIRLNPLQGTEGKMYNPGIVMNWIKKHKEWCDRNNIKMENKKI